MTNLFEKALITGFGIFLIMIFFTISTPFLLEIAEYNEGDKKKIDEYIYFTNEIDIAIASIINNPNEVYSKSIHYPRDVNLILNDRYVKFEIFWDGEIETKIIEYDVVFMDKHYIHIESGDYHLKVFYYHSLMVVDIY